MPWKECSVMDQRLQFVAKLLNERCLPGFWDFSQDGLQDLLSVQGERVRSAERPLSATGALCQSAAAADGEPDRRLQARKAPWGCAQDSRAAGAPPGPGS